MGFSKKKKYKVKHEPKPKTHKNKHRKTIVCTYKEPCLFPKSGFGEFRARLVPNGQCGRCSLPEAKPGPVLSLVASS